MHESGIVQSILETALHACSDTTKRITEITVVAGVFAGIEQESLELYFSELSKGTIAEGAEIVLKQQEVELVCCQCGHREMYVGKERIKAECEKCGGLNTVQGGNEMYLESIKVEGD